MIFAIFINFITFLPFRFDYHDLLENSTFCLVPRGRRLGSFRFLEALEYGCIPIIMADGWDLPFQEVLDWSRFSVSVSENALLQVPSIVRSFSDQHILRMRQQALFVWEKYFNSIETIVHTTLEVRYMLYYQIFISFYIEVQRFVV